MLLLAGYANGHRRKRLPNGSRVICHLPQPTWFLRRLASRSLESKLHKVSKADTWTAVDITQARIVGFAILGPDQCRVGNLARWSAEGDLLWEYMGRPMACFTLKIKKMYMFDRPVSVSSARGHTANVSLAHTLFQTNTRVFTLDSECFSRVTGERVSVGSVVDPGLMLHQSCLFS